jgi:hypothetical protein
MSGVVFQGIHAEGEIVVAFQWKCDKMILMQRGLVSYTVIKVFGGKFQDVYVLTYIISALFLVNFFLVV